MPFQNQSNHAWLAEDVLTDGPIQNINYYLQQIGALGLSSGLAVNRPTTPTVAPFYYATDTQALSFWNGTTWTAVTFGGAQLNVANTWTAAQTMPVLDKGGHEWAAEAFGAVGNASTDNSTAINNAVIAATPGGTVTFGAGIFKATALNAIPPSVSLKGVGAFTGATSAFGSSDYTTGGLLNSSWFFGTWLYLTAASGDALSMPGTTGGSSYAAPRLRGLGLVGPGSGTATGLHLGTQAHGAVSCIWDDVWIRNFSTGLNLDNVESSQFGLVDVAGCTQAAAWDANTNGNVITTLNVSACGSAGTPALHFAAANLNRILSGSIQACCPAGGTVVQLDTAGCGGNTFGSIYFENTSATWDIDAQAGADYTSVEYCHLPAGNVRFTANHCSMLFPQGLQAITITGTGTILLGTLNPGTVTDATGSTIRFDAAFGVAAIPNGVQVGGTSTFTGKTSFGASGQAYFTTPYGVLVAGNGFSLPDGVTCNFGNDWLLYGNGTHQYVRDAVNSRHQVIHTLGATSVLATTEIAANLYTYGLIFPVQAATGSAPAYVKGGLYFDTSLNKLRVGGASGWETVTSV